MNYVDEVKRVQEEYFSLGTSEFWKREIGSLPNIWKIIVENGGNYIVARQ